MQPTGQDVTLASNRVLTEYHVDRLYEVTACPQDCFLRKHPTMWQIKKDYGAGMAEAWLVTILADINEFCGVKTKMTAKQMQDLARIITSEYSFITTAEMMLFAQRIKSGRYGQFYGTIDPQVILIALRDRFINERYYALEEIKNEEKLKEREQWKKEGVSLSEYTRMKKDGTLAQYISTEQWNEVKGTKDISEKIDLILTKSKGQKND